MQIVAVLVVAALLSSGVATPSPSDLRNIGLSERISARVADDVWPHWSQTPFAIDLLTSHGSAPVGVTLPSPRPAFPVNLEATFPLANGVTTIVIGEPQYTQSKDPTRWSVVLLHEHFHAWQYSQPGYQQMVGGLGLAPKNAKNAMWMLNYPFPYSNARIGSLYSSMAAALATAVEARGTPSFAVKYARYLAARRAFRVALPSSDYRYFAFQCWQEGVARYTEYTVAEKAVAAHRADRTFLTNTEAAHLANDAMHSYRNILRELRSLKLADDQRVAFYSLGAGEALLLDRVQPSWRTRYFSNGPDLSRLFPN